MILACDCTIKSVEEKQTKEGKKYLDVVIFQQGSKYDNHIFIFGKKVEKFEKRFSVGDTCVFTFNYFWSAKSKKDVIVLEEVAVC